jgi:hypothetical protein
VSNQAPRQGIDPAGLKAHKVAVTVAYGAKDSPTVVVYEFYHVAAKMQSPAGVNLINQEGETIAFFPYDVVVSVVAQELDVLASQIVKPTLLPFPSLVQ